MLSSIGDIRDVKVVVAIAKEAITDHALLKQILLVLENGKVREQYIASWILSRAVEMASGILDDDAHQIGLKVINRTSEGGIKRNIIRIWQFSVPSVQSTQFEVLDKALNFLSDSSQDVAVRVFSITVLERLLKQFPEIKEEVTFLLEREYTHAKPSFKVRADRFFKAASRL